MYCSFGFLSALVLQTSHTVRVASYKLQHCRAGKGKALVYIGRYGSLL